MRKLFGDWLQLKSYLHHKKIPPLFSEREIWACHLGVNVGFEMDGKKDGALRPVLVFKKLSHQTCLGIPLTGKQKQGSWYRDSYVGGKSGSFCFHQIRIFDAKRFKYRMETISSQEFKDLKESFFAFIA